jgi:hypothetical protein
MKHSIKRLLAALTLATLMALLSGCYVAPGYSYVQGNGAGGDVYYGASPGVVYNGYGYGYGVGYWGGYYGCCWGGRYYGGRYWRGGGGWHGRGGGWSGGHGGGGHGGGSGGGH